jgi:alpha-D-xyloside xylohydrolase
MREINRRQLGKGFAAAALMAALPAQSRAGDAGSEEQTASRAWTLIHPGIWRATIGTPEKFTPVSSRLVAAKTGPLADLPTVSACPLEPVRGGISQRGTELRLRLEPHEGIYGFGLQFFAMAHRGKKRVIRVNADPKADTGDSHAPVPFYVSTKGYGVLVDTARFAEFNCGNARPRPVKANNGTPANVDPNYTEHLLAGETSEVMIEVPEARGVDVYLFAGPSMLDAVRRYNLFSGGGVAPPEWGLGFWYRADSHSVQQSVESLAQEFRTHKMPCDVIGLEPGWQSHAYSCTFVWNKERFPDPAAFVKKLGAMDLKVNLWEHAFTHPDSPLFEPLQPYSGDMGVWSGLVPDFAGPEARKIFGEYHAKTFLDIGISGFKIDECDNSDYTGGWSFPSLSRFPSGVDGEQMHSVFGLRYQRAIWEQYLERNQETYGLVRSSGALAAPYPFVLYSDLYDHRQFIRALVNSGFSGLLWCPEVRDAKSEEDLIRRLQSVVFSPLAMVNGWYIANPPWKQLNRARNNANELMENWQQLEARCREILGWRMQMIPYLRAAFARYAADGTPPFRALVLDAPEDAALLQVDDQYMIGDRMMVAPLFAGEASRKVVIPGGGWHDFWTGEAIAGPAVLDVPASYERIPVYVKAGSVLPMGGIANSTADPATRALTVRIFGDGSLPFSIAAGKHPELLLAWKDGKGSIEQRGAARPYSVTAWIPATAKFQG